MALLDSISRALSTKDMLPKSTFERTVDWRIQFWGIGSKVDLYATEVNYPSAKYKLEPDSKLGISGFYNSVPVIPEITMKILADKDRKVEQYFVEWCEAQYNEDDGTMIPARGPSWLKVWKVVRIRRLSQVNSMKVLENLIPFKLSIVNEKDFAQIRGEDEFLCKIAEMPNFSGDNRPSLRILDIKLIPSIWNTDDRYPPAPEVPQVPQDTSRSAGRTI